MLKNYLVIAWKLLVVVIRRTLNLSVRFVLLRVLCCYLPRRRAQWLVSIFPWIEPIARLGSKTEKTMIPRQFPRAN